jgi:Transposase DDE domain
VTANLDALLTALYVLIDDHVIPAGRRRPGRPKKLSDAELVCLAVAQVLLGARSEHHWLRLCRCPAGTPVPVPAAPARISQADHGRCTADLQSHRVPGRAVPVAGRSAAAAGCHPGPCGTSRETVRRSELAGWAGYGYCAAHSRWYWGLKLYLLATPEGMPVTWCLAGPRLGEREVAAELLGHARDTGALRDQMIVLADKGLAGREMERFAADQARVLLARPDRKDEKRRFGNLAGMRQWIEAIFDTLKDQLSLERHGGRTPAGVFTRIAQRMLALAAAIWNNWRTGQPVKRSLTAYDH